MKSQTSKTRTVEMVLVVDNAEVVITSPTPHITVIITGYPQYSFTFCVVFLVQEVRQQEICGIKDAGGGEPRGQGTSWERAGQSVCIRCFCC